MPALSHEQRVIKAEVARQKRIRAARDQLEVFIEECARDENGRSIQLAPLHRAWIWHIGYCWERGMYALILAPFGSGKSTTFAVPLAAWLIGKNQQSRIQVVSNGEPMAKRRVSSIRQLLESPSYKEIFPNVRRGSKWADHELFVSREGHDPNPSILARGVSTQGVGSRSDATIFDDVCDEMNVSSEARRNKIKGLISNTWMSRLDQIEGRLLWIATPWHVDDATHMMMADSRTCTLIQRVSADLLHYDQEVINAGSDYLPRAA